MSDFKFSCPNCDQHIAYDESYYGVQINCPACSTPIKIPVPAGHASQVPAGARNHYQPFYRLLVW